MIFKNDRIVFDETGILSCSIRDGIDICLNECNLLSNTAEREPKPDRILFHTDKGILTLTSEIIPPDDLLNQYDPDYVHDNIRIIKITCTFQPECPLMIDRFTAALDFAYERPELWPKAMNSFHWIPNIKMKPYHIAGHHSFRSPVVIVAADGLAAALIPDIVSITEKPELGRYLDLQFEGWCYADDTKSIHPPRLVFGIASNSPDGHVYYKFDGNQTYINKDGISLTFYLLSMQNTPQYIVPGIIAAFQWNRFARLYESKLLPQTVPFTKYAHYGNEMALQRLWQEGPLKNTGGIVLSTFRRSDGQYRGREYADDIWFHCWFNNMRTAMELAEFGMREGNTLWVDKAYEIARTLASSPQKEGIFPTIYAPWDGGWIASSEQGGGKHLYSLPDCAWSAIWLRKFIREYGSIDGAESFLAHFRSFLYKHQNPTGGFPCWVYTDTLIHDERLNNSSSGALPVWFLCEEVLSDAVPQGEVDKAVNTVVRGADHLIENALRECKFEDFELYYSCSGKPLGYFDQYTKLYGQNTLAIQWCAESLRAVYLLTNERKYLDAGLFCLSLLSLYQQVWDTPHLDFYTFGGFGVMNTDGEWNDARQAQFAETFMNYYDVTGNIQFLKRAVAAARASFALMAIEENKDVCPRNYTGLPDHGEFHGCSAENYGHSGLNKRSGQSGYHWGTGSALVTAARIKKRYGDLLIDLDAQEAVGIDGIAVKQSSFDGNNIILRVEALEEVKEFRILCKSRNPIPAGHVSQVLIDVNGFTVKQMKDDTFLCRR